MRLEKLAPTRKLLEELNRRVVSQNNDRVIIVLGDEGVGKSTYMLYLQRVWKEIRDRPSDPESVLEGIVWGVRPDFVKALRERDEGSMISVQDAPHVLFKRDAMNRDQVQVEKNLLDVRILNFVIVLGFQDWSDVPSSLQRRRAGNVLRIPSRGVVKGYGSSEIDERRDEGEWPNPVFEDRFDDLEGTELWQKFSERDRQAKVDRLNNLDEPEPEDVERQKEIEAALRAVLIKNESYREAAKVVPKGYGWVGSRVREWKDGKHRDILPVSDVPKKHLDPEIREQASG